MDTFRSQSESDDTGEATWEQDTDLGGDGLIVANCKRRSMKPRYSLHFPSDTTCFTT